MALNVELLKQICDCPGAPGFEDRIRSLVLKEVKPLADEVTVDNIGNIIAVKKGKENKRVMSAAHMDEIGFIVTHIDDKGFVRFHTLGGFDPKTLTAQRVIIHGKEDLVGVMGCKPIHMMEAGEKEKAPKIKDFYIDLGMSSKEEVEKYVSVGDPVTRQRELIEMGDCVNCKSIDNRISVFVLIETLKLLKGIPYDFYAVFSVQEEVGIRGASVAAHTINPNFGIALDTTIAFDTPDAKPEEAVTHLGKGTAIKIMDGSTICDTRMVDYLKQSADKAKIQWQPEVLPFGGTDTAGIQRMGKTGSIAGAISIPTRHLHQVIEMANKHDIEASIQLLKVAVEQIDSFNWEKIIKSNMLK